MVLNEDILCEIFDFAGFSDTAAGARLSRVSKWVRRLLVPRIFKFLVLDNYSFARLYNAFEHTPPPFALHVEIIAILNTCCIRAPSDGPRIPIHHLAYLLDSWWLPPDSHAPLPELHLISACCFGAALICGGRTSLSRIYFDSGWGCSEAWPTEEFPVLTHLGLREYAAKRSRILHHVNALLHRVPPALPLQALFLRLHTLAPELRTTGIWAALHALHDERIILVQTADPPAVDANAGSTLLAQEDRDSIFKRTQETFIKYVSGVEDPWVVGERVYIRG
ncbi:hypothetical protein EXIGLDRAFT_232489 [Exidia glandulosa HHB12029]|uniref:Uncharacterized protein n=1 Tax=Exidia glandulosa HHB12029 TaxID=1314781 RepID=A0A165ZVI6_EXIGL|nr:hypothetical protein EXIGLDRAFT_232489 [Exidia glandulosa HHB12029]